MYYYASHVEASEDEHRNADPDFRDANMEEETGESQNAEPELHVSGFPKLNRAAGQATICFLLEDFQSHIPEIGAENS